MVVYRHVPEGRGGVIKIEPPSDNIMPCDQRYQQVSRVGTYDCQTCVGVYFPIDAERCFCAHINAFIARAGGMVAKDRLCNKVEGETVYDMVLERLKGVARDHDFDVVRIDNTKVVLVCPQPEELFASPGQSQHGLKKTGWYVIDAIKKFLEVPQSACDTQSQGFVFDHPGGEVQKISKDLPAQYRKAGQFAYPEADAQWKQLTELNMDKWELRIAGSDQSTRYADAVKRHRRR